jgi:hypothetical protein
VADAPCLCRQGLSLYQVVLATRSCKPQTCRIQHFEIDSTPPASSPTQLKGWLAMWIDPSPLCPDSSPDRGAETEKTWSCYLRAVADAEGMISACASCRTWWRCTAEATKLLYSSWSYDRRVVSKSRHSLLRVTRVARSLVSRSTPCPDILTVVAAILFAT